MKKIQLIFTFISTTLFAQVNTEVHVFDILKTENGLEFINGKNISENKGYDSQPFFYDENQVIFASEKDKNTDILVYNLITNSKRFISDTKNGGEYSPQRIPNADAVSAVRLNDDGLQRFYTYDFKTGKNKLLIDDLKVAYPTWIDKNKLAAVSIVNDSLHLFLCDVKKKTNTLLVKNVGRSVAKIPNSSLISFTTKDDNDAWILNSYNLETKEIKAIISLKNTQDIAWLSDGTLLIPDGNRMYSYHPEKDKNPRRLFDFTDENINTISRIAINKNNTKLAIVAEVSPEYLAEEQLKGYNNRDIDAFLKPFSEDVKIYNFPNDLRYEGIENMRNNYTSFFENTPDLHCEILKRIVFKDKVIDHELITANGKTFKAVAIYKMENGKITSVTFL